MSSNNDRSKPPSKPEDFLNTLSPEEYLEKTMTPGDRSYMYHSKSVNSDDEQTDTNMGTSDEESDSETAKSKKSETKVKTTPIKKEDVDADVSYAATTEASTQTVAKTPSPQSKTTMTSAMFCSTDESSSAAKVPVPSPPASFPKRVLGLSDDSDESSDDDLVLTKAEFKKLAKKSKAKKKKSVRNAARRELYGRCMMVHPPKSPMSPQDVIYNERCDHCGRVGEHCLNQRYGRYCIAVVYRYFRNNRCTRTFTEAGVVQTFKDAYISAYDRDMFLRNNSLTLNTGKVEVVLPGCLEARSLIFAIIMVLWEFMISVSQHDTGYDFTKGRKK